LHTHTPLLASLWRESPCGPCMPAAAAREGLTLVGRVKRQERGREREREEERGRKREREGRPRRESPGTKRQRERACVEKGGSGRGKVERGERGREEKLESREKIYLGGGKVPVEEMRPKKMDMVQMLRSQRTLRTNLSAIGCLGFRLRHNLLGIGCQRMCQPLGYWLCKVRQSPRPCARERVDARMHTHVHAHVHTW
jgi:hypothetical protein